MTAIASHLSPAELEAHYKTAADPVSKSDFHAIWLLSLNYGTQEVAKLLAFSPRWLQLLVKRYNEHGPDSLGDRRQDNGMAPAILTPEALSSLRVRPRLRLTMACWLAQSTASNPYTISAAGMRLSPSNTPSKNRGRAIPKRQAM